MSDKYMEEHKHFQKIGIETTDFHIVDEKLGKNIYEIRPEIYLELL